MTGRGIARWGTVVGAALAALAVTGCAAVHRPATDVAQLTAEAPAHAAAEAARRDTIVERLARRAVRRGDATLDILLLSGGGQNGAYGAGFLHEWSGAPGGMPRFDLVTGISTGTLQAPFALLGTDAALDTLVALYRRAAEEIAPTLDLWALVRRTGGLLNTARYRRTLEQQVDAPFADRLRAELAQDRQLVIATADFDLAVGRTWDVARELGPPGSAPTRVHDLLMAATAIPGVFPPMPVDGHVHADAGVISNMLMPLEVADFARLRARLTALGVAGPVTVRVWGIWNTWVHDVVTVMDPADRRSLKRRGDFLLFYAAQPAFIRALHTLPWAVAQQVPGLRLEVRHTVIPSALGSEPGAQELFDGGWMRRLEAIGRERARAADPWDPVPSAFARP